MPSRCEPRILVALALVASCNQTFGVTRTNLWDAAPPDAPFQCPAIGTAPVFLASLHQFLPRDCSFYSISPVVHRATAQCADDGAIEQAEVGGVLQPTNLRTAGSGGEQYLEPQTSAEGDEIWIHFVQVGTSRFDVYRSDGAGAWSAAQTLPVTSTRDTDRISSPTARSAGARHILFLDSSVNVLHELVEDPTGHWAEVQSHTASALGVEADTTAVTLSRDGLRLILHTAIGSTETAAYSDRARIDDPFHAVVALPTLPLAHDGYLEDDCSRFYVSGLGAIFFAQQQ